MIDFASVTQVASHDPLVVILGLFIIGGLTTHLLFKRHPLGRAVVRVVFLILLTIALDVLCWAALIAIALAIWLAP